ncbi:response regulator transcription factor [Radiobacillus deserti]|nr:response regulator [Radiobacillus deserti]
MKVIIAEDELLERKAMRKFLETNFQQVEVIGEASNGRKAIELAESLRPDVMLMDIKMPGINGLEAIEIIHQFQPSIKFVLVSAYDSFEYAKQAMKFGVKEYILKPSKKEETIKAMLRIHKEIEEERKGLEEKEQTGIIAKKHFLSKLMKYEQGEEVEQLQKALFPNMMYGCFFAIKDASQQLGESIEKELQDILEDTYISDWQADQVIVLLMRSEKFERAKLLKHARLLQMRLGKRVYIGVGHPTRLSEVANSYHQSLSSLEHLMSVQHRNYGFPVEEEYRDRNSLEPLLNEIQAGDELGAIYQLNQLIEETNRQQRTLVLHELYYKIKQLLEAKQIKPWNKSIHELQSNQDWVQYVRLICLHIQQHYQSKHKIERAKTYIQEHYAHSVSLEEVADLCELSPNYFSNLFKETTGETFIDYVTNVRLNKASQLLEESDLSLKEISFMVGYKDPNYFSRVFKKYYQLSPKQYQQKLLKK